MFCHHSAGFAGFPSPEKQVQVEKQHQSQVYGETGFYLLNIGFALQILRISYMLNNAQSMVALYHPSPSQPIAGSNVLQLGTNEQITVCRGYILGTNAFDDDPTILDDQIRSWFPNANWQGKNYHLRVDPDNDGLAGFLAWLADYLARAIEGVPA